MEETNAQSPEELKEEAVSEDLKNDVQQDVEYYKQELEKVTKHKENLEKGIKVRDKKIKEGYDEDEVIESIYLKVEERFKEREADIKADLYESEIESTIDSMSENEDEKELIKHYLDTKIKRSGFSKSQIHDDVFTAKLLANKNKLVNSNKMYKELLKTKSSLTTSPSFSNEKKEEYQEERHVSQADKLLIDRLNERRVKRGEKPLSVNDVVGR